MTLSASSSSGLPMRRNSDGARRVWCCALVGLLAVACLASVAFGARPVGWSDVMRALTAAPDTVEEAAIALRIPRTVLAALAGAALGMAGAVMQGVTRNPLADPGILGVNAGAALAVVIGIAWFGMSSIAGYLGAAVFGAGVAVVLVYAIGSMGRGGATPLKLALAGAGATIALSSFTTALILPRNDIASGIRSWQVGGVGGATWDGTLPLLPVLAAGFLLSMVSARSLNLMALGDDAAAGLGLRVARARGIAAVGAVLLCGASTAACGPIGFVGLVVPHACRLIVGADYRWLLPFSALIGALLLIVADVVGRMIARPAELDVGIVTAFVGAPVFIWIVRQKRLRAL